MSPDAVVNDEDALVDGPPNAKVLQNFLRSASAKPSASGVHTTASARSIGADFLGMGPEDLSDEALEAAYISSDNELVCLMGSG